VTMAHNDDLAWHQMPATARKLDCEAAIERALAFIKAAEREPDDWERFQLCGALSGVMSGMYGYARTCAALALTPPSERSPEGAHRYREELDQADLQHLTRALKYVRGMPAKKFVFAE
jgi:hypothetical protein